MEIKKAKKISENRSKEEVDLRDYEREIRNKVDELDREDSNWDWELEYVDKHEAKINWGYTKYYLNEPSYRQGYVIRVVKDDPRYIYALDPSGNEVGFDTPDNLEFVMNSIGHNAHTKW